MYQYRQVVQTQFPIAQSLESSVASQTPMKLLLLSLRYEISTTWLPVSCTNSTRVPLVLQYFVDYKLGGNDTSAAPYREYFLSFLGFTAQVPNVVLNGVNLFCQCRGYVQHCVP